MRNRLALGLTLAAALASAAASAADTKAGEQAFVGKGCAACHGPGGASTIPANPVLKGKEAAYIKQQLVAFRSGERQNPTMNAMARLLNDADVDNVAAYLAAQ